MVSRLLEALLVSPARCGVTQVVVTGVQSPAGWTCSYGALTAIWGEDSARWPERRRQVVQGEVINAELTADDIRRAIAELPIRVPPLRIYQSDTEVV